MRVVKEEEVYGKRDRGSGREREVRERVKKEMKEG